MRASGILLHIASLPSNYGIGQLGSGAKKFVDFLVKAGQKYWQVLPLVPTGYGDSPYQSCGAFAGNEYFIDLSGLVSRGLLKKSELNAIITEPSSRIDYEQIFLTRTDILKKAFRRFLIGKTSALKTEKAAFKKFVENCEYFDYALFRALKEYHNHKAWTEWTDVYKFSNDSALAKFVENHKFEIEFYQWAQFEFASEWADLKSYANSLGIKIIGDLPIYVAYDSVECWKNPSLMQFDENLRPLAQAGCPPDYFSQDGQLWGNPIYDWDKMKSDGYKWWIKRLKKCFELFDVVRIDHFRGFDRYFAIPYGAENARSGEWRKAPGAEMFAEIEKTLGKMNVIAEDLGTLDDSAREMFAEVGYPGMKILEYAFDNADNPYLPHNYTSDNCVVYTGTHDNDTIFGYISNMSDEQKADFKNAVCAEYDALNLPARINDDQSLARSVVRLGFESRAALAVNQLQDFCLTSSEGRINTPSTLSTANWSYRIDPSDLTDELAGYIKNLTASTNRI